MRRIILVAVSLMGGVVLASALVNSSIGSETLPPDPGDVGKATMAGIDSDSDGVRDDIQRYVAFTFPDSARVRAAFTQYAQRLQEAILLGDDRIRAVNLAAEVQRATDCIDYLLGGSTYEELRHAQRLTFRLRAEVLNTKERSRAYRRYDSLLAGGVFKVLPESE